MEMGKMTAWIQTACVTQLCEPSANISKRLPRSTSATPPKGAMCADSAARYVSHLWDSEQFCHKAMKCGRHILRMGIAATHVWHISARRHLRHEQRQANNAVTIKIMMGME